MPVPAGRRGQKTRFYCIQLHLASHLHFDFRLEDQGVLRSWAVPKGLSCYPATRRLAIQVEDHPRAYGQFSGIIPSGYGAGIVALWDQGIWQPLTDDLPAAWRRGHVQLLLCGERMQGAWTLVRGHDQDAKAWFLIKKQDAWAATGPPPAQPEIPAAAIVAALAEVAARQPATRWPQGSTVQGGATGALFRQVLALVAKRSRSPAAATAGPARTRQRSIPSPRPRPRRAARR